MARVLIKNCAECGAYTMKDEHCEKPAIPARPAKYSPEDHYGEYRRKLKKLDK